MVLAEEFRHEVINFEFQKLLPIFVAKDSITVFGGPSDVGNFRGDQGDGIGGKNVYFIYFSHVRRYGFFCVWFYILSYLKMNKKIT